MDELINQRNLLILLGLIFIAQQFYRKSERFKSRPFVVIGILIDIAVLIWLGKELSSGLPWIFFSVYIFMNAFSWYFLLYPEQKERGVYKVYYCIEVLTGVGLSVFFYYYYIR
ncbi:hypothetical protein BDE36_1515 [Arcticibacter tournemirensis]|nr:hypothetical protein BDE36_1515 [Arcticibacter tournemirensis]